MVMWYPTISLHGIITQKTIILSTQGLLQKFWRFILRLVIMRLYLS